jgi:hypothetical protein
MTEYLFLAAIVIKGGKESERLKLQVKLSSAVRLRTRGTLRIDNTPRLCLLNRD